MSGYANVKFSTLSYFPQHYEDLPWIHQDREAYMLPSCYKTTNILRKKRPIYGSEGPIYGNPPFLGKDKNSNTIIKRNHYAEQNSFYAPSQTTR
jgi:hypothetical protein